MLSATITQLAQQPYHMHEMPEADAVGQEGLPGAGPYMTVYLRVRDSQIEQAAFETYGCPSSIACGSWLVHWVEGRTTAQAMVLEANDLALVLGGLPLSKEHCAVMAVGALRDAIGQLERSE